MTVSAIFHRMGNRLKELRKAKGWKQHEAAEALGMSRGHYIKLERSERRLNEEHLKKIAEVFDVTEAEALGESAAVPIIGLVGAGPGGSISYQAAELGEVIVPTGVPTNSRAVALEVRGDSMHGQAEDGWFVLYDSRREPPDDLVGRLCVVEIEDGRTLVKWLRRGHLPGRFNLESTNAPTMRDIAVQWAAQVTAILPPQSGRMLMRRLA